MLAQILFVAAFIVCSVFLAQLAASHSMRLYALTRRQNMVIGTATVIFLGIGVWVFAAVTAGLSLDPDHLSDGALISFIVVPQVVGFFVAAKFIQVFVKRCSGDQMRFRQSAGAVIGIYLKFMVSVGALTGLIILGLLGLDSLA
jgi:hypothetical protein